MAQQQPRRISPLIYNEGVSSKPANPRRRANRNEAQICISDQHSGHRYCVDLSRVPPRFFEKGALFLAVQNAANGTKLPKVDVGSSVAYRA